MGITPSVNLSNQKDCNHFGVGFGHTDRFRLVLAPYEIINTTRSVLSTYWAIQEVSEQPGFMEFKLQGTPFCPGSSTDVGVKYMMCAMLKEYYALGWHFKVASDLQRAGSDSSMLIFERSANLPTYVMCLSLNSSDKIRILGPENMVPYIRTVIMSQWPMGIQREEQIDKSWEFKLKGNPWGGWSCDGPESYQCAILINALIETLHHQGWVIVGAIKTGRRQYDLNSLYFRYEPSILERNEANNRFFALSLNRNDRIRLLNAPQELISAVRAVIPQYWAKGIQEELTVGGTYEFKLKGNPWWCDGVETVDSRRLVAGVFSALRQYNWNLYATCELTMHLSAKSVFFFQNNPHENLKQNRTLCVSLNETDKIRVIDASQSVVDAVRNSIVMGWPKGIQEQFQYGLSWQFKLHGYPFSGYRENPIYAIVVMMYILNSLQSQGLSLISSASVSGKFHSDKNSSYPIDLSSWYFVGN